MPDNASVAFFDRQFQRQVAAQDLALNPFESAVLPFVGGHVLDFGCGLGNLAIHAARQGHSVLALDASPTAIAHIEQIARNERLPLDARCADLRAPQAPQPFDTVVSIGLLMFFDCDTAFRQLDYLVDCVRPGGIAAINVLTEGTTYTAMFSAEGHCLFAADALRRRFADWTLLHDEPSRFAAPGDTVKVFSTVIARRPR